MFTSVVGIIVTLWLVGGVFHHGQACHKAAIERAKKFNSFVKAMEQEFGEYEVSIAARKHDVPLSCEEGVKKTKLASLMGWL